MRLRRLMGVTVALTYVGVLGYATAGTQCPVRPESGCARVHALMLSARPPAPPPAMVATPMRADLARERTNT